MDEEGEPRDKKENERSGGESSTDGGYVWLNFLDAVSDITKLNWNEVWTMHIGEFFTYLTYTIEKHKREKKAMEEAMNKAKQTKHY